MGKRGKREFVQVLRLMENFRKEEVLEKFQNTHAHRVPEPFEETGCDDVERFPVFYLHTDIISKSIESLIIDIIV